MLFNEIKEKIINAINDRLKDSNILEEVSLVDGFVFLSINMDSYNFLNEISRLLPTVAMVGNKTGRIYIYALKSILPDIYK